MGKVVKVCTKLLEAISAAVLLVLTLMVFLNVMLRYTFNSGIVVTEELGRYFLVWIRVVGSVLAAGTNSHVRGD
ncbi:MAG: TRAP transporter small permease subunit, partial [Planctomycetota bacterium]|nr:TRAP transporter small permease subunit [Planctomycetota bacterium]